MDDLGGPSLDRARLRVTAAVEVDADDAVAHRVEHEADAIDAGPPGCAPRLVEAAPGGRVRTVGVGAVRPYRRLGGPAVAGLPAPADEPITQDAEEVDEDLGVVASGHV